MGEEKHWKRKAIIQVKTVLKVICKLLAENSPKHCLYESSSENTLSQNRVQTGRDMGLTIELGLSQDAATKAKSILSITYIKGRYWWMMGHLLNTRKNIKYSNISILLLLLPKFKS